MSVDILRKIRQAQRRLNANRFLAGAAWSLTAFLTVAAIVAFIDKVTPLPVEIGTLAGSAIVGGLLVAALWAYFTRRTPLDAAVELDQQFGLKERISTLLTISDEDSPAIHALRSDVEARAKSIRVADQFPLRLPRHGWVPALPFAALLAVAFLVGPLDWLNQARAKETPPEEREKIVQETKLLEKKLEEKQKLAAEQGLGQEIQDLTAKVEKATKDLAKDNQLDAKEAALKLSDLAKSLEERQKELSSVDNMKRNLSKLAETPEGPAEELSKSLKQGDLQHAANELKKLQEKLEKGELSKEQREQLARQMSQMKDQLSKMANLSDRAEQLKKSLPKEMLEQELAKLAKDAKQMEKLKEMAEQLGKCSECLSKGDLDPEALEAMIAAGKELQGMLKDQKEMQMLEEMLNDMAECRGGMCEGKDGKKLGQGGQGLHGKGIGKSGGPSEAQEDRQDAETRSRKMRANGQPRQGQVNVVGTVEGGKFRGDSKFEIEEAVRTASTAADEAITRQKVPKEYQQHTRDYFERLHGQVKE